MILHFILYFLLQSLYLHFLVHTIAMYYVYCKVLTCISILCVVCATCINISLYDFFVLSKYEYCTCLLCAGEWILVKESTLLVVQGLKNMLKRFSLMNNIKRYPKFQ